MRKTNEKQAKDLAEKRAELLRKKGITEPKIETKKDETISSKDSDIKGEDNDFVKTKKGRTPDDDKQIYDPILQAPTIEREYANNANVRVIGNIPDSTPEPEITAPIFDFNAPIQEEINLDDKSSNSQSKFDAGKIESPGFRDMTPKQKNSSSEYLAETAINAYVTLNNLGKKFVQFDEGKQQRKALDGEFDFAVLNLELPMSEDGSMTITVAEFLDTINKQAEEAFEVSDDFKREVKPILTEIFKKKGWGLTAEQKLISLVIEDAAPKVAALVAIKSSMNQILKVSMQLLEQYRGQTKQHAAPPRSEPQYNQPAPTPPPNAHAQQPYVGQQSPEEAFSSVEEVGTKSSNNIQNAKVVVEESKVISEIREPGEVAAIEPKNSKKAKSKTE